MKTLDWGAAGNHLIISRSKTPHKTLKMEGLKCGMAGSLLDNRDCIHTDIITLKCLPQKPVQENSTSANQRATSPTRGGCLTSWLKGTSSHDGTFFPAIKWKFQHSGVFFLKKKPKQNIDHRKLADQEERLLLSFLPDIFHAGFKKQTWGRRQSIR